MNSAATNYFINFTLKKTSFSFSVSARRKNSLIEVA